MENPINSFQAVKHSTVAFTGRRTYRGEADEELRDVVRYLVGEGYTRFLCGMSWGFDLAAGRVVAELKGEFSHIKLVAVEPFVEFRSLFSGDDALCYDSLLAVADERVVVGDDEPSAYMHRNDFLVDNSSLVVAWWDSVPRGGTAYTIRRARKCKLEVINLYPDAQLELQF